MGFSLRRMLRHPFGSHSVFHAATHNPLAMGAITALVPPVGAAVAISKAVRPALGTLKAAFFSAQVPAAPSALPGGVAVAPAAPDHRAARRARHARGGSGSRKPRRASSSAPSRKRGGRKLKFGSPAWRAKYMKRRRK